VIWLDPRVGSGELLPYFKAYDVEVEVEQLEYGDACWWGEGHRGLCLVGVERKVIGDLVSSMRSNRLSGHQLPGLLESYYHTYLIVEGIWQAGVSGEVEVITSGGKWVPLRLGSRAVLFREVDHYLATMEHKVGLTVMRSANRGQTVAIIASRWRWWQKEWTKHDSNEAVYSPYEEERRTRRASFTQRRAGPVELVASQFPGISKKAWEFGKRFKSVSELVSATEKDFCELDGVGKKGAKKIYEWIHGNGKA